jgi:hypothetical protein
MNPRTKKKEMSNQAKEFLKRRNCPERKKELEKLESIRKKNQYKCDCECHDVTDHSIMHIADCCHQCKDCGIMVLADKYLEHNAICKAK